MEGEDESDGGIGESVDLRISVKMPIFMMLNKRYTVEGRNIVGGMLMVSASGTAVKLG